MPTGKLTALGIRKMTTPGRYSDGGNLYFVIRPSGSRAWVLRFALAGQKPREMGLGSEGDVSLAQAREKAREARVLIQGGQDPLKVRDQAAQEAQGQRMTFREVAGLYITAHTDTWKNPKHRAQWASTLDSYAHPVVGDLPIAAVAVGDVMRVLDPIWKATPETASRLRGRIESIIDYAAARGWRTGDNPARWKGHLSNLLAAPGKLAAVEHHAAMEWGDCPAFMVRLAGEEGTAALALRFTILTAARTSEVTGATWGEVDLQAKVWTVPGARMKAGREHRVPLSPPALAILQELHTKDTTTEEHLFPGRKPKSGPSNMGMTMVLRRMELGELTVHGFRSSFRDWCAAQSQQPREVAEAALAHTLRDKTEAAYRRGDLLERRAILMGEWAAFLARPVGPAQVIPLHRSQG